MRRFFGPETLGAALAEHRPEVLIVRSTKVPRRRVIEAQDTLRGIIRAGAGYDNIDTAAASAKGVAGVQLPGHERRGGWPRAGDGAHHQLRSAFAGAGRRASPWALGTRRSTPRPGALKGLTLLLVGNGGHRGARLPQRASAFGMDVVGWSRSLTPQKAKELGVRFGGSTREQLFEQLRQADVVSLHVAATPDTKGMCDDSFFKAMKDGAYFINTARGTLVDEESLLRAVQAKGLRGGHGRVPEPAGHARVRLYHPAGGQPFCVLLAPLRGLDRPGPSGPSPRRRCAS
ncbi:MAG: 2-hydroxyacid dehydrogenase [Phycisphaerales bacterium]|nr:MAG: 2-hydroxyacid dehydrogenase [Phycisphaerales bacterium]